MFTPRPHRTRQALPLWALLLSLALHLPIAVWFVSATYLNDDIPEAGEPLRVSLLDLPPVEPEEPLPEPEEEELDGQIVEIAPPDKQQRPEEADFLAEYNSTVPEESVDPRFRVDRKVTAPTYSDEDAQDAEDDFDVNVEEPSTGALAGRADFLPDRYSLYPNQTSPWDFTNAEGLQAPVPSSQRREEQSGSPSNDYLPEVASSDRTALNAHEFLYAAFWNRVKQLVSFYADQTLANARPRTAVRGSKYELRLKGAIATDGTLVAIDVVESCGIREWDEAIREAFQLAAPFPDPPRGAADSSGHIPIEDFGFTIFVGGARAELNGIDPRQNVQFPGLQTFAR